MTEVKLLSPWRRTFQWLISLSILLLPWFRVDGKSLLRLDVSNLNLYFFGQILRIQELYLFLFFALALVLFFLLITLIFGRVWCGWSCPQTTLNDIAEWLARSLGLKVIDNRLNGTLWQKLIVHICYILIASLVSANLLWYFIEPRQFFSELFSGQLHFAAGLTLGIIFITIYIDLALIRRLMCSDFCPYGRIQASLVDPGTLALHLPESEADRCIKCNSCVRACPMGIDIREGYQVECINCGRCLDACRKVMAHRQEQGLIHYTFGTEGKGFRALINPRTLLIATALICLVIILGVALLNRAPASLKISHSHLVAARQLENGDVVNFFNAWVNNRSQNENIYHIDARDLASDTPLRLKGQVQQIKVPGGKNRRVDFVLVTTSVDHDRKVEFVLKDRHGQIVALSEVLMTPTKRE